MAASAFELLRSNQRRSRQSPHPVGIANVKGIADRALDDIQLTNEVCDQVPMCSDSVGMDHAAGVWWTVGVDEIRYFDLSDSLRKPIATQALLKDMAVTPSCIAAHVGLGQHMQGLHGAGFCAVAVCADMRMAVYNCGVSTFLSRPVTAPADEVPTDVLIGSRGVAGGYFLVIEVLTKAGHIFSLTLEHSGDSFSVVPTPGRLQDPEDTGLFRLFKRIRLSFGGVQVAEAPSHFTQLEAGPPLFAAECVPDPAGTGVLAISSQTIAFFVRGEPQWVALAADVLREPQPQLLAMCVPRDEPQGVLLLYKNSSSFSLGTYGKDATVLVRLAWPSRAEPPEAIQEFSQVQVGRQVPSDSIDDISQSIFLASSGSATVVATCVNAQPRRFLVSTVYNTQTGLVSASANPLSIEASILGLSVVVDGTVARIVMLTPHGPLDSPLDPQIAVSATRDIDLTAPSVEEGIPPASDSAGALSSAYFLYCNGKQDLAKKAIIIAFSRLDGVDIRAALENRTWEIANQSDTSGPRWQDVRGDVVSRHLLFDKARDLQQWAAFLTETGVWTHLGSDPDAYAARYAVAEACERVAAATLLRDLHDRTPKIFARAIHDTLQGAEYGASQLTGDAAEAESMEMLRFYGKVTSCERIFGGLIKYPRSLPLGSNDVAQAVLLVQQIAVAFLDAALGRRQQLSTALPTLLPQPSAQQARRYLKNSTRPPKVMGSQWLVCPSMRKDLDDLQQLIIVAAPSRAVQGFALLDAQGLQLLEILRELCCAQLETANACFGDLHCPSMSNLRRRVLCHLEQAERGLPLHDGCQRTLLLAERFEDIAALVSLSAECDPSRLEGHLQASQEFRYEVLAHCLQNKRLWPHFFQILKNHPVPAGKLEDLMGPYPELRWTLDVKDMGEHSSEADWQAALKQIESRASAVMRKEVRSASKQDAFGALAAIARRAAGVDAESKDPAQVELTCIGRLNRVCLHFSTDNAQDVRNNGTATCAPATAENCLIQLSNCISTALPALRAEKGEGKMLADIGRLVRMVERSLSERDFDEAADLLGWRKDGPSHPTNAACALLHLWAKAVQSDRALWKEAELLGNNLSKMEAVIAKTAFFRMLAWHDPSSHLGWAPPRSSSSEVLCRMFSEVREFGTFLRHAEDQARRAFTTGVAPGGAPAA